MSSFLEFLSDFRELNEALAEFEPQLLIYNAGTDVLQGDKLGGLSITEKVVIDF